MARTSPVNKLHYDYSVQWWVCNVKILSSMAGCTMCDMATENIKKQLRKCYRQMC